MKILSILPFALIFSSNLYAELSSISDEELDSVSGQSGITINAKVKLGDRSRFVYTNTNGKTLLDPENVGNLSYVIADKISGAIELKGLKLDLIDDLNSSGKSALQWTLPDKIIAEDFKIGGIYASTSEAVDTNGVTSSFLVGLHMDGTLTLPASTAISVFVVE